MGEEASGVIKNFIQDMIHMTEGEKFFHYWWLWLSLVVLVCLPYLISKMRRKG